MSLRFTLARMMCTLAFTSTLACTILSQTTAVTVGSTVRAMDEAVPAGWTILDSCSGDLNQDLLVDLVLVIQAVDSAMSIIDMDTVLAQPRSIVVLFGSDMGGFSVFAKNDRFIPLHFDSIDDEPLSELSIENGKLFMRCRSWKSMGSWWIGYWSYGFQLMDGQLRLTEARCGRFHRATHESDDHEFDLLSGEYLLIKNRDLEQEGKMVRSSGILDPIPLKTLSTMERQGSWRILPNVDL